ncbi:class I histocompatibility antigen, F10 alpha chain-like [Tiliqua scincoides]|uniref:class I histocompatibility antigen, F10 alpha chain-like n=1 Tax=Tiliqua scincoides TaxID=71010 RepID=UPI0034625B41
MRLLGAPAALLLAALVALRGDRAGSSSHSVKYFYTAVSEPSQELPWFLIVGYMDGQRFFHYDSAGRRAMPAGPWMDQVCQEDPHYWDQETQSAQGEEATLRSYLEIARQRYNQSGGLHTMQLMYGCELSEDGRRGFRQYGYDGRDFLAFDKETLTWTAADGPAQITKRKWEVETVVQRLKFYLEKECVDELRKHLRYGRESLQRKAPPEVKVTRKDSQEGLETLLCQVHGFYPKEIYVTWRKDGKVRQEDVFRGVVSPNPDGTYYTWLSIEIDPKDRSRYLCHVEHDGVPDPLDVAVAVEDSASMPVWFIAVGVVPVLAVAGVMFYVKKRPEKAAYRAASMSDQGSDSSAKA